MFKKIYNLLINFKNKFIINKIDNNIYEYILNLIRKCLSLSFIPQDQVVSMVVSIWLVLLLTDNITINRLIRLGIILIIICMYKILYKEIYKIYLFLIKYINITDTFLLKIYCYKNPIILILIEIELVLFHIIRYIQINNVQSKNINFIYHILYNISGLNGIKIILAKAYKILLDWKKLGIYELLFKRIYGMVLSILVFTNLINLIIMFLNMITENYYIWVYIFLVIIPYIYIILGYEIYTINDIEHYKKKASVIWSILSKVNNQNKVLIESIYLKEFLDVSLDVSTEVINKNIKICLGLQGLEEVLTYNNFLIFLILSTNNISNLWYRYFNIMLQYNFDQDYIHIKNALLKKNIKNENDYNMLSFSKYNILLYKLRIFYIWDVEKFLGINESLLIIKKKNYVEEESIIKFSNLNTFFNSSNDAVYFLLYYNSNEFNKIFTKKNIQNNNFFDLYNTNNNNFYENIYNYLHDYQFKQTKQYQILLNLKWEKYEMHSDQENLEVYLEEENEIMTEYNGWKKEWNTNLNQHIMFKYTAIFFEIDKIKNYINNAV